MKKQKGFSLLELVVVLAIISIFATLTWASLSNTRKSVQLDGECNKLAALTNKARGYALAGKIVGGVVPSPFSVECLVNATSCSLKGGTTTVEALNFSNGIRINAAATARFSVPSGASVGASSIVVKSPSGTLKTLRIPAISAAYCQ